MAIRQMNLSAWTRAVARAQDQAKRERLFGDSPGTVAERLGVTRQRVHQLCQEDRLHSIQVTSDNSDEIRFVVILEHSVKEELDRRQTLV